MFCKFLDKGLHGFIKKGSVRKARLVVQVSILALGFLHGVILNPPSGFTNRGGFDSFFSGFRVFVPGKKKVSERLCSGRLRSVQGFHLTCHCKLWGRAAAREENLFTAPKA